MTSRMELELAGVTDEQGRVRAFLERRGGIWSPPDVATVDEFVCYPWPKDSRELSGRQHGISLALEDDGWKKHDNTQGLLTDFANLPSPEANHRRASGKVRDFVMKWGPLWLCSKHHRRHHCCFWDPQGGMPFSFDD